MRFFYIHQIFLHLFFKNFFFPPFVIIDMRTKSTIYTLIILSATIATASAQSLHEILNQPNSREFSEITIDYTLRMPLLDDDVVYTLILHSDSVTAIPYGNRPKHTSHISRSQFASLHPDSIAACILRLSSSPHHSVTYSVSDSIITISTVYSVDSIIGSISTYTLRYPSLIPTSIETINNPSSITEQTISAHYISFK